MRYTHYAFAIVVLAGTSVPASAQFFYSTNFSEFSLGNLSGQSTWWTTLIRNGGNEPTIAETGGNRYLVLSAPAPGNVNRASAATLNFGQNLHAWPFVTVRARVLAPSTDRHNLYFHTGAATNVNALPWRGDQRLADNNFFKMLQDGARHDARVIRDQFIEMRWEMNYQTNMVRTFYDNVLLDNLPITASNNFGTISAFAFQMRTDFTQATFGGQFFVDDVSVEAVPEPASLAVLGLGALALLRRRRR